MTVEFDRSQDKPNACQLFLAANGTKEHVKRILEQALSQLNDNYGKPCQGITLSWDGDSHIITPVWNHKPY